MLLFAGCADSAAPTGPGNGPSAEAPQASARPLPTQAGSPMPRQSEPAATPPTSPWTDDPASLAWHRLGTISASVDGVVGFAAGYVALDAAAGVVWYSPNGRAWQRAPLPFDPPHATPRDGPDANGTLGRTLATNGHEVLVVGGYSHEPCQEIAPGTDPGTGGGPDCDYSPVTWISDDGLSWRAAYPDAGTAEFVAAWPVANGWDVAVSSWDGESLGGQETWHSDDGHAWARLKPTPPAAWEG